MDNILIQLYQPLDIAIFSKENNNSYKLLSKAPSWLHNLTTKNNLIKPCFLNELFPFLECVLPGFEEHWDKKSVNILISDPWIETNQQGEEIPLEASAIWLNETAIILIKKLGKKYYKNVDLLQKARDTILIKEQLESEVIRRTKDIKQREEEIAIRLSNLTSFRDTKTGEHVRRIGYYAAIVAEELNWSRKKVEDIRIAAPMHDIGKISIRDNILLKKGKLTKEEFEQMQQHTVAGYNILKESNIAVLDMAAEIALSHHEKWDGTGYPYGTSGEDIPEAARITSIVDIYDALVHKRVYKNALSEDKTLKYLKSLAGHHIDANIFAVFLKVLPSIRKVSKQYS